MPTENPKQPWESRIREAASHVEEDVQRLIRYINDDVVPDVRRNGSVALKAAANEMQRLAERMDAANRGAAMPSKPPPGSPTSDSDKEP